MAAVDPLRLYLKEINSIPQVTEEEIKELYKAMAKGDENAKKRMIEGNLRLVVNLAKHYTRQSMYGLDFLDYIEEGNLGLIKAIEKYDPKSGYKFSTYAYWWIRQYIQRAILNQSKSIYIPVYAYDTIKKLIRVSEQLQQELERRPTTKELSDKLQFSMTKTRRFLQDMSVFEKAASLDSEIEDNTDIFLKDLIPDEERYSPDQAFSILKMHDELNEIMGKLTDLEMEVIKLRFGFYDGKRYTLRQIGKMKKLTHERIRQIEKKALERLKRIAARMNL